LSRLAQVLLNAGRNLVNPVTKQAGQEYGAIPLKSFRLRR
jgi:hypothetical protein